MCAVLARFSFSVQARRATLPRHRQTVSPSPTEAVVAWAGARRVASRREMDHRDPVRTGPGIVCPVVKYATVSGWEGYSYSGGVLEEGTTVAQGEAQRDQQVPTGAEARTVPVATDRAGCALSSGGTEAGAWPLEPVGTATGLTTAAAVAVWCARDRRARRGVEGIRSRLP